MTAYNHHLKAGNQGDVVKHPALIAALDKILAEDEMATSFHYVDLFAGHAWHPLIDDEDYQWKAGIGRLSSQRFPPDAPAAVKCWREIWYASPEWPVAACAGYPGSAWFAAHRCRNAGRAIKLELYDHSEEVRRDLEKTFPPSHAIQAAIENVCLVGQSLNLVEYNQRSAGQGDFVFIDPPGWHSSEQPSYPRWKDVFTNVLVPRSDKRGVKKRATLMWMPAGGHGRTTNKKNPDKENPGAYPWDENSNGDQREKCESVRENGYSWTAVRWGKSSFDACILVYNCAELEIKAAVDCIVRVAGYEKKHSL